MRRIILLAAALGAAHAADSCTAVSATADSGWCKGTTLSLNTCLPADTTSSTGNAVVLSPSAPCNSPPASHAQGESGEDVQTVRSRWGVKVTQVKRSKRGLRALRTHDALIELCSSQIKANLNALGKSACDELAESLDCTAIGGKANPDYCKENGHFCKQYVASFSAMGKCDGTCPVTTFDMKQSCCSDWAKMVEYMCTGVDKAIMDALVRILLAACTYTGALPCLEHNSALLLTDIGVELSFFRH